MVYKVATYWGLHCLAGVLVGWAHLRVCLCDPLLQVGSLASYTGVVSVQSDPSWHTYPEGPGERSRRASVALP